MQNSMSYRKVTMLPGGAYFQYGRFFGIIRAITGVRRHVPGTPQKGS